MIAKMNSILLMLISVSILNAQEWIHNPNSEFPELLNKHYAQQFLIKQKVENSIFNGKVVQKIWNYAFDKQDTNKLAFKYEEGYWDSCTSPNCSGYGTYCYSYLHSEKYEYLSGCNWLGGQRKISFTPLNNSINYTYSIINNKLLGQFLVNENGISTIIGYYNNNIRKSLWWFYDPNTHNCIAKGKYFGESLLVDSLNGMLTIRNSDLKKLDVNKYSKEYIDSLKSYYNLQDSIKFPLEIHFKHGEWIYYSNLEKWKIIKREFYQKGRFIK